MWEQKRLSPSCLGSGIIIPITQETPPAPGNPVPALSLTRDKGYGGLKPEQTHLLLKFA